ncbi:branched-chain amino acid transaminase [Sediminicurvatus halobius]|uniref:Branched-chain-amino-acid aminotransferase n=1 Tax=Sediminicurvatus halobius TaxID=2182432 RepID=A0A2U2N6U1_9GAMM|nr:branched-chain amino acid transaminase [Spiribacter halobius]PWG64906.1 branched chain amino acid aminotransferase [Spiribacter halobius]UEX78237.1 branched-chain amino acid transaminase [Spiribacter halobius]
MSMADRDGVIWMDGELVPWRDARIHVLTHTLHYGLGVFEGIRAYHTDQGPAVFRLPEHVRRFFDSAKILGMTLPWSQVEVAEACRQAVRENGLKSAYIRPMAFYGAEGMGLRADNLQVHLIIAAWEWGSYLGAENIERGIRVRTSSFARHHVNVTMCRAKANGHYINSMLALQEAVACGYDEALLLDTDGFVAEGSGENFFLVRDGVIHTPELASALAGVTRDAVMTLAREAGYEIRERRITRDEVYVCDEAFFTGTAAEVTPIRELDDRPIGEGRRGPVTADLQERFFAQVEGRREAHPEWLTPVA